jgi:hypothetical protein
MFPASVPGKSMQQLEGKGRLRAMFSWKLPGNEVFPRERMPRAVDLGKLILTRVVRRRPLTNSLDKSAKAGWTAHQGKQIFHVNQTLVRGEELRTFAPGFARLRPG